MSELLADVQQLDAVLQEQARVAVTQVVNPRLAEFRLDQERLPHAGAKVVGVHRFAGRIGKEPALRHASLGVAFDLEIGGQGYHLPEAFVARMRERRMELVGEVDPPRLVILR